MPLTTLIYVERITHLITIPNKKVKPEEVPLYYRVTLRDHSFWAFFLLLHVTDRVDFYITQICAHEVYFKQKNLVVWALQR